MRIPKVLVKFDLSEYDSLRLVPSSDLSKLVFESIHQPKIVEEQQFN